MTRDFKPKELLFSILILALVFCAVSCGGDDDSTDPDPEPIDNPDPDPIIEPEPDPLDSSSFNITFTLIRDAYEEGKASDLVVSFDAPKSDSVASIRLFGVLQSNAADVGYHSLSSLTSTQFIELANNGDDHEVHLTEELKDFKGDSFQTDTTYVFYTISSGTYLGETIEILSGPSAAIEIIEQVAVSTLVTNFIADDGLTLDKDGNIYASEFTSTGAGTRIMKVTPSGETSVFADGLSGSLGNVFDNDGNFYVTNNNDSRTRKVIKITPDGTQSVLAIIPGYPAGLILDKDENLLVSNYSSPKIYMVSLSGDTAVYVEDNLLRGSVGMAYDDDGNLLAGNFLNGDILSISPDKVVTKIASIEIVVNNNVVGYITYLDNHVYATGIRSNKIYKVSLDGNVELFAGTGDNKTFDAPLLEAKFSGPNGITADKENKILYISQFGLKSLRKIQLK